MRRSALKLVKLVKLVNSKQAQRQTVSRSRRATSRAGSKLTHEATDFLSPYLPTGWARSFEPVHAGRNYGLRAKCPVCGETPPPGYNYRRWRWLSVHIAKHK